jgi:hypothetical protein
MVGQKKSSCAFSTIEASKMKMKIKIKVKLYTENSEPSLLILISRNNVRLLSEISDLNTVGAILF